VSRRRGSHRARSGKMPRGRRRLAPLEGAPLPTRPGASLRAAAVMRPGPSRVAARWPRSCYAGWRAASKNTAPPPGVRAICDYANSRSAIPESSSQTIGGTKCCTKTTDEAPRAV
jgi:hypothetical protein